jgi:hypothetical protein
LDRGQPISFDVPREPRTVVSGLRLGNRVLVRRTDFGRLLGDNSRPITLTLNAEERIRVSSHSGNEVVKIERLDEPVSVYPKVGGRRVFPIGCYELPGTDEGLRRMTAAGVNLVHCADRRDLDRVQAANALGWISVPIQQGATTALRERIESVVDHPALAVWEGPDEIVWTFTAYSFLKDTQGITREDWESQAAKAVEFSRGQAATILPRMREGAELIRQLDTRRRPIWMNEAADSDARFARGYMDSVDIAGCDYYAVRSTGTDLGSIGRLVKRWSRISRGRPIWMVLQGFSWHTVRPDRTRLYPTFSQSRFMAYDAIVHGANGILYWGTSTIDDPAFRQSLYALVAELDAIQPFLVAASIPVSVELIDNLFDPPGLGVRASLRQVDSEWLLILVNEDGHRHLGVDVSGLELLEGRKLYQLYGADVATVEHGRLTARLQGHEVRLYSTRASYAAASRDGRDYVGP